MSNSQLDLPVQTTEIAPSRSRALLAAAPAAWGAPARESR